MTKKQPKQKMGRRPKQTSFQRKHTDSQQVPEKRLGTDNSWRNANQNYSMVHQVHSWVLNQRKQKY